MALSKGCQDVIESNQDILTLHIELRQKDYHPEPRMDLSGEPLQAYSGDEGPKNTKRKPTFFSLDKKLNKTKEIIVHKHRCQMLSRL